MFSISECIICRSCIHRHKPTPPLTLHEQPLYLLAALGYNIAALELSIRSSIALEQEPQDETPAVYAAGGVKLETAMHRFSSLSKRRHSSLIVPLAVCIGRSQFDPYPQILPPQGPLLYDSDEPQRSAMVAAPPVGSSSPRQRGKSALSCFANAWDRLFGPQVGLQEEGARPLLLTELFPFFVTWTALEWAVGSRATSSVSPTLDSVFPFAHITLSASVAQLLLSLLLSCPKHQHEAAGIDELTRQLSDCEQILRFFRASITALEKNDDEENDSITGAMSRLMVSIPSLEVSKLGKQIAAEQLLQSVSDGPIALTNFIKAHSVPMLRRITLFSIICHDLATPELDACMQTDKPEEANHDGQKDEQQQLAAEYDTLATFLGLPPLEFLLFGGDVAPLWQTLERWWHHLYRSIPTAKQPPVSIPCVASPTPFKLIELPYLFQGVFCHMSVRSPPSGL